MKKKTSQNSHSYNYHPSEYQPGSSIHKGKEYSAHTKPSFHDQTNQPHKVTLRGNLKNKKSAHPKSKEKTGETSKKNHLMSSKSSKKMMKISFPKKSKKDHVVVEESVKFGMIPSVREYCIIEGNLHFRILLIVQILLYP